MPKYQLAELWSDDNEWEICKKIFNTREEVKQHINDYIFSPQHNLRSHLVDTKLLTIPESESK